LASSEKKKSVLVKLQRLENGLGNKKLSFGSIHMYFHHDIIISYWAYRN